MRDDAISLLLSNLRSAATAKTPSTRPEKMAGRLARVDLQGVRPDGTDFLIRTWAHVEQIQGSGANSPSNRLIIEIRQPFVWGVPAGPLTTQTVRRRRLAARRRGERQAAKARSRQSAGFRERLAIAREAIE